MTECSSVDSAYYQRNRDVILNRAKYYYQNGEERLRKQARDIQRNLSEKDKNKRREYGEKDTAICPKKNYRKAKKCQYNNE